MNHDCKVYEKNIVFSGIQPSGSIHLGNYLGAIKQWLDLQEKYKSFFCIVDLHAITSNTLTADELKNNTLKTAATYIACGIDPKKSLIFNQSAVSQHSELCWILGCSTPLGWLNRMTQFKDKTSDGKILASLGLYSYPVLMASDILLYKAKYIPVGDDQKQHLELACSIASTFNNHYKKDYFVLPEALFINSSARIMSLKNGTKKMSKSESSDYSRININDPDDLIIKKIRKAKTDSILGFDPSSLEKRPEIRNMVNIYSVLSNISIGEVCKKMDQKSIEHFKNKLADLLIATISPIRKELNNLLKDQSYLCTILKEANEQVVNIADQNMREIKNIVGFIQF
ncbi:tryptophan--tRNA ligase [Wolbachia endosymbiont of Pentidionis agamae]|uniref:tryptophan--tRNA ligase n=1 Tax=Wolbachia endosymbiont of Pentidionis agamae TaxID=3110435 RepID=UPI002FD57088